MTNKTLDQLTSQTDMQTTDLFAVLRPAGAVLKSIAWSVLLTILDARYGTTPYDARYLQVANNLSDVANAATARANLAVQAPIAFAMIFGG